MMDTIVDNWVKVKEIDVVHVWEDSEGNECQVNPDWYEDNGTPLADDGEDMKYSYTMVKQS